MPRPAPKELSPRQLREAIKLGERIEVLRQKLRVVLGEETKRGRKRGPANAKRR